MSNPRWQQVLHVLGVATFFVCLGWTIPYMITVPFLRLQNAFTMMWTGMPILLGRDLTTMAPCALAVCFVLYGKSVRAFWSRWPWSGPFILVAFIAALGTILMAHLAYVSTAYKYERWSVVRLCSEPFLWRVVIMHSPGRVRSKTLSSTIRSNRRSRRPQMHSM